MAFQGGHIFIDTVSPKKDVTLLGQYVLEEYCCCHPVVSYLPAPSGMDWANQSATPAPKTDMKQLTSVGNAIEGSEDQGCDVYLEYYIYIYMYTILL